MIVSFMCARLIYDIAVQIMMMVMMMCIQRYIICTK